MNSFASVFSQLFDVIVICCLFCFQISEKCLEVTLWDFFQNKVSTFMGEVLLDLYMVPLGDQVAWYPLEDHDENSSPLPPPTPKVIPGR